MRTILPANRDIYRDFLTRQAQFSVQYVHSEMLSESAKDSRLCGPLVLPSFIAIFVAFVQLPGVSSGRTDSRTDDLLTSRGMIPSLPS